MVEAPGTTQAVLFVDLTDSTRLYERLGDTAAREFSSAALRRWEAIVEATHGRVVKRIGDELMCVFDSAEHAARAAMEAWQAENGRNLRNEIEIHAAIGDRDGANRLAAELDARPGGPMMLLISTIYCACGAPFDLEATPNFRERIRESAVAWPLETLVRYPAKDW